MEQIILVTGTRFLLNSRSYEIGMEIEKDTYMVFDIDFPSVKIKFTREQILKLLHRGELQFSEVDRNTEREFKKEYNCEDFSMLPKELREIALFRLQVIKPLINLEVGTMKPYVKARVNKLEKDGIKVSSSSIYRWLKVFHTSGNDIQSLVPRYQRQGIGKKRLSSEAESIIHQSLYESYPFKQRRTDIKIFELILHQIDRENQLRPKTDQLQPPSKSTVRRRVQESEYYEIKNRQKSIYNLNEKYGQITPAVIPVYPLQRVKAVHTRLDLIVVDDETGLILGRPCITSIVDVCSEYPLGFYIGFEPPSYASVLNALEHAISQETYIKKTYPNIQNHWVEHGLPEVLEVDSGKEFSSKQLLLACKQLQIELVHCWGKKTWYNGAVERYFRTINENLLHQTKGTAFSNVENSPFNHAVISFDKLLEYFHQWVVDVYAIGFNDGVKGVPIKLWEKSLGNSPCARFTSPSLDVKIALMKLEHGKIRRTGIRFKHLCYLSEKLIKLLHKISANDVKNFVEFKYDSTDMSKIFVYDQFDSSYFEVLCSDQEYSKGLNENDHKVIVNKLIQEKKIIDIEALSTAKYEFEQMIASILTEHRKVTRSKGEGSNKEWATEKKEIKTETESKSNEKFKPEQME